MRTNRINNNKYSDGSRLPLFITLTYMNDYIPYIKLYDYKSAEPYKLNYDDIETQVDIPVYRDYNIRWFKGLKKKQKSSVLTSVSIPSNLDVSSLKRLNGQLDDKIGVCYYKDLQDFIKRLKINLQRNGFQNNFSFYACSEYGPTTTRPHFHLLLWSSEKDFAMWKRAISEAWPYDNNDSIKRSVEIAKNASSYVSSYVNCISSVPPLLQQPPFAPKHSYSKGFGSASDSFSISSLLQKIDCGNFRYDVHRTIKGKPTLLSLCVPKYIVNRYFPKFMGFRRFNDDTVRRICQRPALYRNFAKYYGIEDTEINKVITSLTNAQRRFFNLGYTAYDFGIYFTAAWRLYASNILIDNYNNITDYQSNIYAYDNIKDYYDGMVLSESLDSIRSYLDFTVPLDPNTFPKNRFMTQNLESAFYSYSKDRKVRNYVYKQFQNV